MWQIQQVTKKKKTICCGIPRKGDRLRLRPQVSGPPSWMARNQAGIEDTQLVEMAGLRALNLKDSQLVELACSGLLMSIAVQTPCRWTRNIEHTFVLLARKYPKSTRSTCQYAYLAHVDA